MRDERATRGTRQVYPRKTKGGLVVWYCRYVDADGKRKKRRLVATTKADALLELQKILARVRDGKPGVAATSAPRAAFLTVRELARKFCGADDDWKSGHGSATRDPEHYRRQAWSVLKTHVVAALGDMIAADVKPTDVVRLRDSMQSGQKHPRSVQRAIGHLSLVFSWAIENGLVDCANPASDVRKPSPKSRSSFYTEAEIAAMLGKAAEYAPDLHGVIAFAFYTGCRKGEIAALRVSDCDLDGGRIIVSRSWGYDARKNGEPVTIQVHPHLDAILRPLLEGRGVDELVFPKPGGGMRPKHNSGDPERNLWGLDEILEMAKVKKPLRPWHSFRHSHGTALAASGAGLAEIQEALGQSSLEMARRYTRVAAEKVRERVHALPTLGPIAPPKVTPISTARRATSPPRALARRSLSTPSRGPTSC